LRRERTVAPIAIAAPRRHIQVMAKPTDMKPFEAGHLPHLDDRSREIFRRIVEGYLTSGDPLGSRSLSKIIPMSLSPASVRNVMSDLEALGLIYAPHTSAGRLPTEIGLRFFVDAMLQVGDLTPAERTAIEGQVASAANKASGVEEVLAQASQMLSGLSRGAAVVTTSKGARRLKHIEFVRLEPTRALVVLVGDDGQVENRVLPLPPGLPASALAEASNYLNARVRGRTLIEAKAEIEMAERQARQELDEVTQRLVQAGLASWAGLEGGDPQLIVRGQANLLEDLNAAEDLERVRLLFADLETKKDVIDLLGRAETAEGVRIFIGSENKLFSLSGSSMIAAPFRDGSRKIVGVLGVIGPTRLNYARIVPMVDYTAKVVGRLLG
jgi:heat-inducible transcriptional repressor